ncbi:hypothetical protein [Nocardioides alcanivorans]|uniref:hypothetical protein n=1 Tax=Nocardioides alcanivorans TaxID=2897352 RepID=UPI001F40AA30|nr:hypothetical protein [Nocardioides alcanivorans]
MWVSGTQFRGMGTALLECGSWCAAEIWGDHMRIRPVTAGILAGALGLTGTLLALPPGAAAPAVAQAAAPPVVKLSGALKQRPSGLPSTSVAARQLVSATVSVEPRDDRARATVVLKAAPNGPAEEGRLLVGFGVVDDGGVCQGQVNFSTPTRGARAAGWSGAGARYLLDDTSATLRDDYDCAYATVTPVGANTSYDALIGGLTPTHAKPKLKVQAAKLLGSKKLKLLRGEWTTLDVDVRNVGSHQTSRIVVQGKGTGLKVKKGQTGYALYPGSTASVSIKVKLTRKRAAKLKLTATGPAAGKATKTVKVRPAKAPKRIKNGTYRSKDKRVNFTVKKGRIAGFRAYAMTTCGGYPDFPTYTWNTYSIPKRKVPKSGIVQIVEKGKGPAYTASLNGRAKGTKVTARFRYDGPNRCWAAVDFTAKRVGR